MVKTKILIVDDSVVVRRLLGEGLAAERDFDVQRPVSSGRQALQRLTQELPDVVVLDVEMPDLNGLDTLVAIRASWPKLPVIMFSSLTERGAATTLDALTRGASDYLAKPNGTTLPQQTMTQLIEKIRALTASRSGVVPIAQPSPAAVARRPVGAPAPVEIVVIGVSTGGPNALAALMPMLPADFPVPMLIVQHMPAMFTRMLAERLGTLGPLPVHEATHGMVPTPGHAYIAPGNYHMLVATSDGAPQLQLNQEPQENSCRPAVDVLFRSAARCYGAGTLAVVLTGMGQDGLRGAEVVVQAGGRVLAQDEATSVVWGMPGAIARAGIAERILPLQEVAAEIARRVTSARRMRTR